MKTLEINFDDVEWDKVAMYPYAGLDFLLGKDEKLYFIEANAIPTGIFFIETISKYVETFLPLKMKPFIKCNKEIIKNFVKMCLKYCYYKSGNKRPSNAGITIPVDWPGFTSTERTRIKAAFEEIGIKCYLIRKNDSQKIGSTLHVNIEGQDIVPDLIVRRTFKFPKDIEQPVINPVETGKITGNKWKTYLAVEKILSKKKELKNIFTQPWTRMTYKPEEILEFSYDLLDAGKEVVIKPLNRFGGKEILFVRSKREAENKIECYLKKNGDTDPESNESFIVQEKIDVMPFHGSDKKFYAFDLRVFGFLGKLAGGQIRRAPYPLDAKRVPLEKKLISNISSGGVFVFLLFGGEKNFTTYSIKEKIFTFQTRELKLDGHVAIIGGELLEKLKIATREIISAINKAALAS